MPASKHLQSWDIAVRSIPHVLAEAGKKRLLCAQRVSRAISQLFPVLRIVVCVFVLLLDGAFAFAGSDRTGFLMVSADRGFLGNQETQAAFTEFRKVYPPAVLALVGRDYNGIGSEYSAYLIKALRELKEAGVTQVVGIPLFVSEADPVLQKVIVGMSAYEVPGTIRWAAPMADSYLIKQIVLDRVEKISKDSEEERLFIVGVGAVDGASERIMKRDLEKLVSYISERKSFKEATAVIYYDRDAPESDARNRTADELIMQAAAHKGSTVVIPATLGPKFDYSMTLTNWIGQRFKGLDVVYGGEELMPHPNIVLWLKRIANQYTAALPNEIGIVIMPHGATQPWNDAVERLVEPLRARYDLEMAFGMADPRVIQGAVTRLEERGIRRIVFVRLYALSHHMKESTDYILGLTDTIPSHMANHVATTQVRSAVLFAGFGGYEESARVADILHERVLEVSEDPSSETVVLLAHGEKTDTGNIRWLQAMEANIERLKKESHCSKLKSIRAATVQEDWPELREKAVGEIRNIIQEESKHSRVLVIANRLYGAGPYKKLLTGLDYALNDRGLAHPLLSRWLEEEVEKTAAALASPLLSVKHEAVR
ncbi:conserved protein of unknown function [Nitrospira japonica]|uniref:Sirohydrochlorin cobaltochelatase n=1 Tax=Nitrospira japonica TaxID=1325564 RepID=A0A1W1IAV0_9BACT|nr:hypothetical protein [Nitrospira japonica]SLM50126.1 conserved protein of unknown function [Nitrospira japonica]